MNENEKYLHEEYLVYDIFEISEEVKKMTREERDREIARLEEEHRKQVEERELAKKREAS